MEEEKRGHEPDRYEDFLDELSHFSAKDEEKTVSKILFSVTPNYIDINKTRD